MNARGRSDCLSPTPGADSAGELSCCRLIGERTHEPQVARIQDLAADSSLSQQILQTNLSSTTAFLPLISNGMCAHAPAGKNRTQKRGSILSILIPNSGGDGDVGS